MVVSFKEKKIKFQVADSCVGAVEMITSDIINIL